jgi:ABC-2 type transport system permease protein
MSSTVRYLRPAAAVVKRDFLIAWSYRVQFVTGLFSGFVTLATFYYISRLVRVEQFSPGEYFAFVAIGVVIFTVVTATLQLPQMTLRQELIAGTFERMLLAPGGTTTAITALLLYPALYALLTVAALVCLGAAAFGLDLQWSTVPAAVPIAILSLLAFAPFGVLLLASVVLIKRAPPGASYVVVGLSLVAGLYFPVSLLPGWIEWASDVQPLTPAAELLRNTLVGRPLEDPVWVPLLTLAAFALIALPLSIAALKAAVRSSRRRGTILEY